MGVVELFFREIFMAHFTQLSYFLHILFAWKATSCYSEKLVLTYLPWLYCLNHSCHFTISKSVFILWDFLVTSIAKLPVSFELWPSWSHHAVPLQYPAFTEPNTFSAAAAQFSKHSYFWSKLLHAFAWQCQANFSQMFFPVIWNSFSLFKIMLFSICFSYHKGISNQTFQMLVTIEHIKLL